MSLNVWRIVSLGLTAVLTHGLAVGDEIFDATSKVNMFMGVAGRGNVVVGPQLPWGSVNPSPDTPEGNSDGYSSRKKIRGFSQLHVTGTGSCGKYGQFLLSPQIGLNIAEAGHDSEKADEVAGVSEYKVRLKDFDIFCEFTPTAHAAIYRFTFPASDDAHLAIDLGRNIPENGSAAGYAEEGEVFVQADKREISGWGSYWGGWSAEPVRVYFAATYDTAGVGYGTWSNENIEASVATQKVAGRGDRIGAFIKFKAATNQPVLLKIAVSFKSIEQARVYLEREIPDWNYSKVEQAAKAAWAKKLGQVEVQGGSAEQISIFYSSLYNTMRMPKNRTGDNPA